MEAEESAVPAQTVTVKEDLSKSKREKKDSKNDDVMVRYILFILLLQVNKFFSLELAIASVDTRKRKQKNGRRNSRSLVETNCQRKIFSRKIPLTRRLVYTLMRSPHL